MVLSSPYNCNFRSSHALDFDPQPHRRVKRQYQRKRTIPKSEREALRLKRNRQAKFEEIKHEANLWSFESLFPDPVWDETSREKDLYAVRKQDSDTKNRQKKRTKAATTLSVSEMNPLSGADFDGVPTNGAANVMKKIGSVYMPFVDEVDAPLIKPPVIKRKAETSNAASKEPAPKPPKRDNDEEEKVQPESTVDDVLELTGNATGKVDLDLTRMVRDRLFGYRRTRNGQLQYDTSLLGPDSAIQFRDGVRLGNPLKVNADRLTYLAKKELSHNKVEEAQELYEEALRIDPRDGRAYLGMGRCAQRRRDFKLAKAWLSMGIANSVALPTDDEQPMDRGANPFLLQALGVLEERTGRLSEAEALYISACKSRSTHAAAWVSLGLLRTRKLGQPPSAGRQCFETAERELMKYDLKVPAHVYTAWASLEQSTDPSKARRLYKKALEVDPKCSVAWLQLGTMEASLGKFEASQKCFEAGLTNDRRNSRILQAYAIMQGKRPNADPDKTISLFKRALKANRRDAGVLQAYGLYLLQQGDVSAARDLLQRGTRANKRHSPVWQAWGVLESHHGDAETARRVFQEGIWACAQLTGGQSGGYRCARLWQAWGVLEAKMGDDAAARCCFSRALDADARNVAAVTAWARMEEALENFADARAIFERALGQFTAGSAEKMTLWRNYELMEQRLDNVSAAQMVYERSMREALDSSRASPSTKSRTNRAQTGQEQKTTQQRSSEEVEVVRWNSGSSSMNAEVLLNGGTIASRPPRQT